MEVMTGGFIVLERKILNHWIWKDPEYLRAWLTILLNVNYEDQKVLIGGQLFLCKRGQSLRSMASWAALFGPEWDRSRTRRFFALLRGDEMIDHVGTGNTTTLTVVNYDTYQDMRPRGDHQSDHPATTPRPQRKPVKPRDTKVSLRGECRKESAPTAGTRHQAIQEYWNSMDRLPACRTISKSRAAKLAARFREPEFAEGWREIIHRMNESDFLTGINDRGWKADFGWLVTNDENYVKVLEGKYDNTLSLVDLKKQQREKEIAAQDARLKARAEARRKRSNNA